MSVARVLAVVAVVGALGVAAWLWISDAAPPTPVVAPPRPTQTERPRTKPRMSVVIVPSFDDRLYREPCNVIGGGGLFSLSTLLDETAQFGPVVGVQMGDATLESGPLGAAQLRFIYTLTVPTTRLNLICPGVGELGQGVAYVREELAGFSVGNQFKFVCANVADPSGAPLLNGYWIAAVRAEPPADQTPRTLLFVSVAARSLQAELIARGSDVVITSPEDAIVRALAEGRQRAAEARLEIDATVLLVQGTVEEARELLTPGGPFEFAIAARGATLPNLDPKAGGSALPVYYPGRGLRFGWQIAFDDENVVDRRRGFLVRLGELMQTKGSPHIELLKEFTNIIAPAEFEKMVTEESRPVAANGGFVGAERCASCHVEETAQHAASAHAYRVESIGPLAACMRCHVTGADHRGGWRGREDTSDRATVSCEACHGPGGDHAAEPGVRPYGAFPLSRCTECHLPDRTPQFDAEAWWREHGHGAPRRLSRFAR